LDGDISGATKRNKREEDLLEKAEKKKSKEEKSKEEKSKEEKSEEKSEEGTKKRKKNTESTK